MLKIKNIIKFPLFLTGVFILFMFIIDMTNIADKYYQYKTYIAFIVFVFGVLMVVISGYSFKKAKTTVNPSTPEKTTTLVKTGLYAFSRNPMYIGFFIFLLSAIIYIGNPVNIIFFPLFVYLANKLYILPEEKILEELFKEEFIGYKNRVSRWISF